MPTERYGLKDHPQREALTIEVHARPYAVLQAPERATHLAMLSGDAGAEDDRAHILKLCKRYNIAGPAEDMNHFMADFGPFRLKWERHTEFSTYTFFRSEPVAANPFENPILDTVPRDWVEGIPGELMVGIHAAMEAADAPERSGDDLARLFGAESFAGAQVADGHASAFMDFWINGDGFGHLLIRDFGLAPRRAGRLLQRLLEIETYRTMALLAFPIAKEVSRKLDKIGKQLSGTMDAMGALENTEDEKNLLADLTNLAGELEQAAAATNYRFGAARAYHALVSKRIEELRESRLEGYQQFGEFMDRRLAPAMRTCEAVAQRMESLSERLARASQMLRTRVDIQLEEQNRNLLHSMDRRARLQLRLQETVEGLSIAAVTYYGVGLIAYLAKGLKQTGLAVPVEIILAVSVPVIAGSALLVVRRIRRIVSREQN
ncbi:MAG: DUF3422 domain-containing protein [Limibacillus sp.]|jgi:uncharacterized membrane-anchored protein